MLSEPCADAFLTVGKTAEYMGKTEPTRYLLQEFIGDGTFGLVVARADEAAQSASIPLQQLHNFDNIQIDVDPDDFTESSGLLVEESDNCLYNVQIVDCADELTELGESLDDIQTDACPDPAENSCWRAKVRLLMINIWNFFRRDLGTIFRKKKKAIEDNLNRLVHPLIPP